MTSAPGRFIDDSFALRSDGLALVYSTTDGANSVSLHVSQLGPTPPVTLAEAPFRVMHFDWIDASHVLIVGEERSAEWTIGKTLRPLPGVVELAGATTLDGKPYIVIHRSHKIVCKKGMKGCDERSREVGVRLLDPETFAEKSDVRFVVDSAGRWQVGALQIRPITYEEGYRVLVGMSEGAYDKEHDIRMPERVVRIDLATGRIVGEQTPDDPVESALVIAERKLKPNQPRLVVWNNDRTALTQIDGAATRKLSVPRPLGQYDADSLQSGVLGDGTWMMLKVDPYNREALDQKRRDPDVLELFEIDGKTENPVLRLVLDGKGRSATMQVAASRVAVLRRQKIFARGGVAIELFDLSPRPTAQAPTQAVAPSEKN